MNGPLKWGYMEMYVKAFPTLDNALEELIEKDTPEN
jgi:hypothetical protein